MVFLSLFHVKTLLKNFSLASLSIKILYAHIILQSIGTTNILSPAITAKGSLIERRGIIIVLNVNIKEIAKIPQEVTETLWIFPNADKLEP